VRQLDTHLCRSHYFSILPNDAMCVQTELVFTCRNLPNGDSSTQVARSYPSVAADRHSSLTKGTKAVTAECYDSVTRFGQRSLFQEDRLRLLFYTNTYRGTFLTYLLHGAESFLRS